MDSRSLSAALFVGFCIVVAYPAHAATTEPPLQSVDYFSSGRAGCEGAVIARTCLLSLQAVVTGGTPPFQVKWILSNGTRLSGQQISLRIDYGGVLYGVCLRAIDSRGDAVFGGHWEFGVNYWSDVYHSHRYAPVNVWYGSVSPPCTTVGQPVIFNGNVFCSSQCEPQPIVSRWSFGDGTTAYSDNANHTYTKPGIYTAELTGIESSGTTSSTTYPAIVIEIGQQHRPAS